MENFFSSQIGIFIIYFLAGLIICLFYDMFRAIRKTTKTSDFTTFVEDIIFLFITAVFLIYIIFYLNSGELRFFMPIAVILGGIFYYITLSKYFMNISIHILNFFKIVLTKLLNIILAPLKLFLKINKHIKCIICINLRNITKKLNKKSKKLENKKGIMKNL